MTVRTCPHPLCHAQLRRYQGACGRHYARLPQHLKAEMRTARKSRDQSFIAEVEGKWTAWFESRVKGRHEVVTCRGQDCRADIVWLPAGERGKPVPVNAETVTGDEYSFQPSRHIAHRATCKNAGDFHR